MDTQAALIIKVKAPEAMLQSHAERLLIEKKLLKAKTPAAEKLLRAMPI